jgi:hypothetical protein
MAPFLRRVQEIISGDGREPDSGITRFTIRAALPVGSIWCEPRERPGFKGMVSEIPQRQF